MKKIIILTAVTSALLITGQSKAWAGQATHHRDDYHSFRKIVHILDDLINDDYRKGKRHVRVCKYSFPKRKICYYRGPYEVCRLNRVGHIRHGHNRYFKTYSKHGHRGYRK